MGTIEVESSSEAVLRAEIILYGNAASEQLAHQLAEEIQRMWTVARGKILLDNSLFYLNFLVNGQFDPFLKPEDVFQNSNPQKNFIRVEKFVNGNISFMDALGSNTGFFQLDNLYLGSTTAAHEFGHSLGLPHPKNVDLRNAGQPGIMYPRGTLVDPEFQYDPAVRAGEKGGTIHPKNREVWKEEVAMLATNPKLSSGEHYVIGAFTNVWHESHDMFATNV